MSSVPPVPTVPAVPRVQAPGGKWAEHIEAYKKMGEAQRKEWFTSLSTMQRAEFEDALKAVNRATPVAKTHPGAWLVALGALVGFLWNIYAGGFLVLIGIALYVSGRKG